MFFCARLRGFVARRGPQTGPRGADEAVDGAVRGRRRPSRLACPDDSVKEQPVPLAASQNRH